MSTAIGQYLLFLIFENAKTFQKVIFEKVYENFNESLDLLSNHQSRFRCLHSTVTALLAPRQ